MVDAKICGLNDPESMLAAAAGGARFLGLVFYPSSPRALTIDAAKKLAVLAPRSLTKVGLFVDPADDNLMAAKDFLGMIQLHGAETPARVKEIRALTGLPVMKAIGIARPDDLKKVPDYESVADMLLFDAKPSSSAKLPGGNAESFDWTILQGKKFKKPWMLGGGLNAVNLEEAVRITGAKIVDVSSGVEDAPGRKNPDKIRQFLEIAKRL